MTLQTPPQDLIRCNLTLKSVERLADQLGVDRLVLLRSER